MSKATATNQQAKAPSLEMISEAFKQLAMRPDTTELDKELGIKAANLKFNQPENYRKMSDEDKGLIDNAIERMAYINRQERENSIMNRIV